MSTTEKMIGKYRVELIDENDKYYAKVYNTKAKKAWRACIKYFSFRNQASRDEYVAQLEKNVTGWDKMIAERRAARKAFVNPAKVGDILCASWGYEQTNIDYYQVTKVIGKMVEVKEICGQHVDGSGYSHGMADMVKPAPGKFVKDGEPIRRLVGGSSYHDWGITIDQVRSAYKINPSEQSYRSWYA